MRDVCIVRLMKKALLVTPTMPFFYLLSKRQWA